MKFLHPTPYTLHPQRGFIAITSAIIISVLLLAITLAITFSAYFARFNVLDSESKERSVGLAEACGDTAILKYSEDNSYVPSPVFNFITQTGGESVNVNSDQCTIASVDTSGSQKIIKTQAYINKSYTNLRIGIDSTDFTIKSWDECTNLSSSTTSC